MFHIPNIADLTATNLEASDLRQAIFKYEVILTAHLR
jgi:hypothetical protein